MRWDEIKEESVPPSPDVPRHIVEGIEAGIEDLKHARGVPGDVVLAEVDHRIAVWRSKKDSVGRNGENRSSRPKTD
jgi:hypothetical protein